MEQLEYLKQELKMLQENIKRLEQFKKENQKINNYCYQSNVVGELKHRITALKQRLTLVSKISTRDLFE